jgi:hypothetical protein
MEHRSLPLLGVFVGFWWASSVLAQTTEPAHPILEIPGAGSEAPGILSGYTEDQFVRFAPEWGARGKGYGFVPAVVPNDTSWSWSVDAPDVLTSLPSGTVFPSANTPPLYEPLAVLSGKTINAPYYLAAGSTTRKSLVFGEISYQKRQQLRRFFDQLAPAYVNSGASPATRNDAYARRIAIALDAWANYVPDYYLTAKNSPTYINATPGYVLPSDIQRASDHNGMAHEWHESELRAFDAIYDSPALNALSVERGYDVREHIKNGLFFNIGDYFRDRVPISIAIATNLSSPFSILAKTARALNRPSYILWMGDYLDATVRQKILRDGVLQEGVGYSYNYIAENVDAATSTSDYFLTRPADTSELEAISLKARTAVSVLESGIESWKATSLPDGTQASFGDTTFNTIMTARDAGNSALLPAYGHLSFGSGAGLQAAQLNQNFSDDANHMRADVTAYTLWANGAELLGNVRYYNGLAGRQFTEQVLAYNAVTIDRTNMSRGSWTVGGANHQFTSGNLTLFEPSNNGISVSEIDGQRAYANKATRYQRVMVLNTVDPGRPYVVDVFRVGGGTTHDYTHYGAIRFDQTGEATVPLTAMPGDYPLLEGSEVWTEPTSSGSTFPYYGFFRNVQQGVGANRFQITYRDTGDLRRDLRLWSTGEQGSTVYLGVSPNPSRTNTTPSNFYTYWRPATIVRHRVTTGPLESLYANVIEPMSNGTSTIRAVDRVPISGGGQEAVALRVWFIDGRFDTYLINLRNPKIAGAAGGSDRIETTDKAYCLAGRVGVYVSRPGSESRVWTVGARSFKYGSRTVTNSAASYSGNIIGVTRKATGAAHDAFIVDAMLPTGAALHGRQLSLTFGTYQVVGTTTTQQGISEMYAVDHVERINGQTHVILTADPQLSLSGATTTELVAPERTFTGTNTFQIVLSTSAATRAQPTPPLPPL